MSADQGTGAKISPLSAPVAGLPPWGWALIVAVGLVAAYNSYRAVEVTGQLTSLERERVSLIQDKDRLNTALTAARKQVDELKSLQATADGEIKKSREDAKNASTQAMQLQERIKALEGDLGGARGLAATAQGDVEKLRQEFAAANKAKSEAEAKAAGLERELKAMSERLADSTAKLEEAARKAQQGGAAAPAPAPNQ
jgi:chromosome segregation ATPase